MAGHWDGTRMVLDAAPGSRFTWRPGRSDRVEYNGEQSTDGGVTWTIAAQSSYRRR